MPRGTFRSVIDPTDKIKRFVGKHSKYSKPFMWTATANSIVAKIERFYNVTAGVVH